MPISASAKKSLRVAKRQHGENIQIKYHLKQALKTATAETLSVVFSRIDKAAKGGVIHKNKASRLKSRLNRVVMATPDKAVTKKVVAKKAAPKAKKTTLKKK